MICREYEYRFPVGRVLSRAILFGIAAAFMTYMALTNDRGLNVYRLIVLSENTATVFYWSFAGLCALFAVKDAWTVERCGNLRQQIAFTEKGLVVPKSATSSEEMLIPYESIIDIKQFTEPDTVAVIRHRDGEFELRLDMLANEQAFVEIVQGLDAQTSGPTDLN